MSAQHGVLVARAAFPEACKRPTTVSADRTCWALVALLCAFLILTACTTVSPRRGELSTRFTPGQAFSHEAFGRVLNAFVDDRGRVDYAALKADPGGLELYYRLIASYSPDSHPALFPDRDHELAYWINAYNAAAMKIVVDYYPVRSITDIGPPAPLFFLPDKWGFFLLHRPQFGTVNTSLYYLENSVIRKRFLEPRIHFALNCASISCPRLPREAFTGPLLQQQLEHEARTFFAKESNLKIDHQASVVYLSSIMDWYQDDFIAWLEKHHPDRRASLLGYVALYVDDQTAGELAKAGGYGVEFVPYDWTLNDQNPVR